MSDSALVTGVGGYVGQHCAAELLRAGLRVRGSVRNAGGTEPIRAAIARVAPVDRLDFVACVLVLFDRDVRGLGDFLGKDVGSDPTATVRDLEWSPTPFEPTVLDMAESLRAVVEA